MSGKSPEKGETEFLLGVGVGMGGIAQQVSAVDYHRLPVPKVVPGPMPIHCIVYSLLRYHLTVAQGMEG